MLEGTGTDEKIPPEVLELYNEYAYRQIFPSCSHDEYLDTDVATVKWMTGIHHAVRRARRDS